jgi:hypothetical protein
LCNEFPLSVWAPFFNPPEQPKEMPRHSPEGDRWMRDSIAVVRAAYPQLDYCFSFTSEYDTWRDQDVSYFDLLELHLWMAQVSDFYERVGYHYERFDSTGYNNVQLHAEKLYRENPEHWKSALLGGVKRLAEWGHVSGKPLMTTECWALVDYKDWPLLSWDYIKELCELGVRAASGSGRWCALATSNFCGPQFVGMWRDAAWHRALTDVIHNGALPW